MIERIATLAIPPAWTDVWICSDPRGHVQATGIDDAGRKQYRYHDDWRAHRDRQKFDRMLDFARRLPKLRDRITSDLDGRGLGFERVCAAAVAAPRPRPVPDRQRALRGRERELRPDDPQGPPRRVRSRGSPSSSTRRSRGRSSKHRISDPVVIPVLKALAKRGEPGDDLLTYRDGRTWRDLTPDQVNGWIKETIGEEFSAKDFRTWNATVVAAEVLAQHDGEETTKAGKKKIMAQTAREVAEFLNNTPAVCRASYIDPRVFDRFDAGETIAAPLRRLERRAGPDEFVDRAAIERAVVKLLNGR